MKFRPFARFFAPPAAIDLADLELESACRDLLLSQRQADYHLAMVAFAEKRIERLTTMLAVAPSATMTGVGSQGASL